MNPIAQFNADEIAPVIASVFFFMIPIVAILAAHQRKMAEIFHRNQAPGAQSDESAALRAELARLTQAVHQNTIAIDNLTRQSGSAPILDDRSRDLPNLPGR